jgi:hypothetical protein
MGLWIVRRSPTPPRDVRHAAARLRDCINRTGIDYLKHAGLDYQVNWGLQGWANVNRRGDYHDPHNHPHAYLSGTYYVAVPKAEQKLPENRPDVRPGAISFYDPQRPPDRGRVHPSAAGGRHSFVAGLPAAFRPPQPLRREAGEHLFQCDAEMVGRLPAGAGLGAGASRWASATRYA